MNSCNFWLLCFWSLAVLESFCNGDNSVQCIVCTSDKRVRADKAKHETSIGLYHKDCLKPDAIQKSKNHTNLWNCADYYSNMSKSVGNWKKKLGVQPLNATDRKSLQTCDISELVVCRSYYYDADIEYKKIMKNKNGEHDDEYKMTGDMQHVFRYCGCIYREDENKKFDEAEKKRVIDTLFGGKSKKCYDSKKGAVLKRRCVCNPAHKDFTSKGILGCNFANELRPQTYFFLILTAFQIWRSFKV